MNDFTVDELEIILDCIVGFAWECNAQIDKTIALKCKVKSMIDNYKEPENIYCECFGQWVCDRCHFKGEK